MMKPSATKSVVDRVQENISVGLRVKPSDLNDKMCSILDDRQILIKKTNEVCTFDYVFNEQSESNDIFQRQLVPVVDKFLQGYNGSICAYGQTSSGKTYTMKGDDQTPGIIPLTLEYLFNAISNSTDIICQLKVSYIELYNETVYDLLCPNRQVVDITHIISKELKSEVIHSYKDFQALYQQGEDQRTFGETKCNDNSSRSHVLLILTHESRLRKPPYTTKVAYLYLVDLAGSEGVSKTQAEGIRRKEGCIINKSLLALQTVVKSLKDREGKSKQQQFINFRDSKLTRILQNSIGGNSLTVFLLTINQSPENLQESINTIRFGVAAGAIKNNAKIAIILDEYDDEQRNDMQSQINILKDDKETIDTERNSLIVALEQLKEENDRLLNNIIDYENDIEQLKQKNYQAIRENLELNNKIHDTNDLNALLKKSNDEYLNQLKGYISFSKKRNLYEKQVSDGSTQTVNNEDKTKMLEYQISQLEEQNQNYQKQIKDQTSKERMKLNQILEARVQQVPSSPLQVAQNQKKLTFIEENYDPISFLNQYLTKSLKKHQDSLNTLDENVELQCQLMEKMKQIFDLQMSLQGKDRTLHEREEELFRIKQKIFFQKPDENNNMSLSERNLMNQNINKFAQKKKVINSPSKEELKKTVLRQDEKISHVLTEMQRYKLNCEKALKEKQNLLLYSQQLHETLLVQSFKK